MHMGRGAWGVECGAWGVVQGLRKHLLVVPRQVLDEEESLRDPNLEPLLENLVVWRHLRDQGVRAVQLLLALVDERQILR